MQQANELWRWTASDLADGIRARRISSREAVQSCLDRIAAVNPALNAVVSVQAEAALAAATAADAATARGDPLGPLHGVPVTTKVNVDQQGLPTTNGVVAFADLIAPSDSPVVANLRKAGAVLIGRTNTPAFSMNWYTDNDLHGRTLNPWAVDRTPGGSSGGAAAAVAAGMCPLAQGNDAGGSVRYPAYCTGTVGLRPSFGRIPAYNETAKEERPLALQLISVQGPIARSVADIRLGLEVMAAPDPRDPWWVPAPLDWPHAAPPAVAVCTDPAGSGVHPAVQAAIRQAAAILAAAGHAVSEAMPPDPAAVAQCWNDFAQGEGRESVVPVAMQLGDARARRSLELMLARVAPQTTRDRLRLNASRATWLRRWQLFMQDFPLILCPVALEPALPYGLDTESAASMDRIYRGHVFLFAIPLLGLPAISVPTGIVDGVPMGVQIVGPRFREDLVLQAAAAIEAALGRFTPIDPVS